MQTLNVHFLNRGFGTDDGYNQVEAVNMRVCEYTSRPQATIASPYFPGDTLTIQYQGDEWVCDLD
jgi:hypothetical protein